MPDIKMPDGAVVSFPDDMPPEQIKALILTRFPDAGKDMFPDQFMQNAPGQMAQAQADADPRLSLPAPTLGERGLAFSSAAINGVPIAGPWLYDNATNLKAKMYGSTPEQMKLEASRAQELDPLSRDAGAVTGNVLPFAGAGMFGPTSRMLGFTGADLGPGAGFMTKLGDFGARTALSGTSMYGINFADQMARGASPMEAAQNSTIPAAISAAVPALGVAAKGLGIGANWMLGGVPGKAVSAANPRATAERMVGKAYGSDVARGGALDDGLDAWATGNGMPITNLDRGGAATRSLARTASNASPDAKGLLDASMDRGIPSMRAANFVTQLVGGSADDIALRQGIQDTGRVTNKVAYDAAYAAPEAQSIWTPRLQQLTASPEFTAAMREAETTGKTFAALNGGKPVQYPFTFNPDGTIAGMKPGVTPSLQFWDQVQRNLRSKAESFPRGGEDAARLNQLRAALNNDLDAAVPAFGNARRGAAGFFGAEDALDAGRQFALQPRNLPEAKAAYAKFSDAEKKAFGIGWASSITDKLKSGADSYAIIKQVFESPANRELAELALGSPFKVQQLKAYTTVEAIMEQSKRALQGNSTTVAQIAALGGASATTGGFGWMTGDWRPLMLTAGVAGARFLGRNIDQKVMNEVATLLTSSDKAALNKLVTNAAMSPQWSLALQAILKGTAIGVGAASSQTALAEGPRRAQ